ncbi:MAG: IMPACT family protein [Lachnospiraceae bacterium]|nr:IMPACT family protein [Lachnospiraceae bacterium]
MTYNTIKEACTGEIVEKKSCFIANAVHVENEAEAEEFIAKMRKKYYDARHNCYAYVLGNGADSIFKVSDDGEPSRTAGMPMLEVIKGRNITNVVMVVTRYFGGTLLGTGGLIRAYSAAAQEALDSAEITRCIEGIYADVNIPYSLKSKFEYEFGKLAEKCEKGMEAGEEAGYLKQVECNYTDKVSYRLFETADKKDEVDVLLREMSGGSVFQENIANGTYKL